MSRRATEARSFLARLADRLGAAAIRVASRFVQRVPDGMAIRLGLWLGRVWYVVDRRHRTVARENLELAFGRELNDEERETIVRGAFRNAGLTSIEFLTMPRWTFPDILEFTTLEGDDLIDEALAEGNGVILLAAHFGNWELMAGGACLRGLPVAAVARPLDQPAINEAVTALRESTGLQVVQRRAGAIAALRTLRKGRALGVLADQNTRRDNVFVEFFGKPAATTPAPAYLALKTGAPIIPCYMIREGARKFRFQAQPRLELVRTGDLEYDVWINTQRCAKNLEDMIRHHPDNWFWIHRRWKTQPPEGWSPPRAPKEKELPAG